MSSFVNRRQNILQLMREREISGYVSNKNYLNYNIYNKYMHNLGLQAELKGDQTYVDCIQWNRKGSTLASASGKKVVLWDPFLRYIKTTVNTSHEDDIFTVKFLSNFNDDILVTGALDGKLHTYNITTGDQLRACKCARKSVNQIAVVYDTPSVYMSASRDGFIRQYDMRMSHDCNKDHSKIKLVDLNRILGKHSNAKCFDIHQLRTEKLAVGSNDPYARLYDRRMIHSLPKFSKTMFKVYNKSKPCINDKNTPDYIVQYFIPMHIQLDELGKSFVNKNIEVTHLTFNPVGQELLVNYSNEYVYLFDILNQEDDIFCRIPNVMNNTRRENAGGTSTDTIYEPVAHAKPSDKVVQLKLKADYHLTNKNYIRAIEFYNEALEIYKSSELFSNRAEAYALRKWRGDIYEALKDSVNALILEPNHMKAHYILAVCLYKVGMIKVSKSFLDMFTAKYPSHKISAEHQTLIDKVSSDAERGVMDLSPIQGTESEKKTAMINLRQYLITQAKDYLHRYSGCRNEDLGLEANFFGNNFIVAGSEDGNIFIWNKTTANIVLVLKSSDAVVKSVQPHPTEFMLATNDVPHMVRLWTPLPEGLDNKFKQDDYEEITRSNHTNLEAIRIADLLSIAHLLDDSDIFIADYEVESIPEFFQ